jgi:hypothetical protein
MERCLVAEAFRRPWKLESASQASADEMSDRRDTWQTRA